MSYNEDIVRLEAADKRYIWHPFTQMKEWVEDKPLIITEGMGCFVKDAFGNWYLDAVSSLWVNIHGHRRPEIDQAMHEQLGRIAHSTLLGASNIPAIQLAEKLIQLTDVSFAGLAPRLSRVFYSDNGSTAVEVALKMAFQYWMHKGETQRTTFVSLRNAYHGDTIGAVSVGGVDIFHSVFGPLLFKTHQAPSPYCYRCPLGTARPECSLSCLAAMDNILRENAGEIAAVILEPLVQAAGGMIIWPEGYLRGVRELCTRYDVLLIADEVATGFGRTGKMFACEHEQIVPDIICLSKGITNGYMPLAVTLATDTVYNAFLGEFSELKTFFHGHSYTGNPLACSAALASLGIFSSDDPLGSMVETSAAVAAALDDIALLPHVGDVRLKGLMAGIELVRDKTTKEPYPWEQKMGWQVAYKAREEGVLMRPLGNTIVIMPPLAISVGNANHLMDVIKRSIIAVTL
jgi:adenosylmethionine-8-amino-7-oxononanoate aminotransferase